MSDSAGTGIRFLTSFCSSSQPGAQESTGGTELRNRSGENESETPALGESNDKAADKGGSELDKESDFVRDAFLEDVGVGERLDHRFPSGRKRQSPVG